MCALERVVCDVVEVSIFVISMPKCLASSQLADRRTSSDYNTPSQAVNLVPFSSDRFRRQALVPRGTCIMKRT